MCHDEHQSAGTLANHSPLQLISADSSSCLLDQFGVFGLFENLQTVDSPGHMKTPGVTVIWKCAFINVINYVRAMTYRSVFVNTSAISENTYLIVQSLKHAKWTNF